jgi:hypothetical protein
MSPPRTGRPNRLATWGALTLILAAACGTNPTATNGGATTTTSGTLPESTMTTAATPGSVTTEAPPTTPPENAAPDFSLQLGDGSTFALSAEQKPVFMVFWAEW